MGGRRLRGAQRVGGLWGTFAHHVVVAVVGHRLLIASAEPPPSPSLPLPPSLLSPSLASSAPPVLSPSPAGQRGLRPRLKAPPSVHSSLSL